MSPKTVSLDVYTSAYGGVTGTVVFSFEIIEQAVETSAMSDDSAAALQGAAVALL